MNWSDGSRSECADRVDARTTDHLIAHMALIRSYDGHDFISGGAYDVSDQDPTGEIKSVL